MASLEHAYIVTIHLVRILASYSLPYVYPISIPFPSICIPYRTIAFS